MTSPLRSAIAAALDHPFHDFGFDLVDRIEAAVRGFEPEGDPDLHEVSAELTDLIMEDLSTLRRATLWALLSCDGNGYECGFYTYDGQVRTEERITLDLYPAIEEAVHTGLIRRLLGEE